VYRFLLVTMFFAVAGCVTPGQETSQPEYMQTSESTSDELPASNQSAAVQTVETAGDELEAPESSVASNGVIEYFEAPTPSEGPIAALPPRPPSEPEVICTREVTTGSILKTKVCRSRADIERQREHDQRALRRIKTHIDVGAPRPGINSN